MAVGSDDGSADFWLAVFTNRTWSARHRPVTVFVVRTPAQLCGEESTVVANTAESVGSEHSGDSIRHGKSGRALVETLAWLPTLSDDSDSPGFEVWRTSPRALRRRLLACFRGCYPTESP